MKKVAIVGSVGYVEETSSGQVIRTRILRQALVEHYGEKGVYMINTSSYTRHAIPIVLRTIASLFVADTYIVILSGNGRKVFFPILRFFKKVFGKRVLNNVIGGDYAESVRKYPKYIKYSNSFDVNWVQMPSMKREVENEGIRNVEVLPNSKPLVIVKPEDLAQNSAKPYRFCTFSRVSKAKGTELAIEAIERINRQAGETVAELTIFGKPDEDYAEEFKQVMARSTDAIRYGGVIAFDQASKVLSDYYMLLFPTTFYGEGFPGTILDAYASGLPVLASDWKFNPELIESGKTGELYDHNDHEAFYALVKAAVEDPEAVDAMRIHCVEEAEKYTPANVMPIIFDKIDLFRK